jgi:hypothetical protein
VPIDEKLAARIPFAVDVPDAEPTAEEMTTAIP